MSGMVLVMGIDEAGRGSVIGPMVLCGYVVEENMLEELVKTGVADSKTLEPEKREEIYRRIIELAYRCEVRIVEAKKVNESLKTRGNKGLNFLEVSIMAEMINSIKPRKVIIDSPERNTEKLESIIRQMLSIEDVEIICENKADHTYPIVSAASIIAKVTRDREIAKLRRIYGDFGSGYPSDPRTIDYIKSSLRRGGLPEIVRADWRTVLKARQLTLEEF